MKYNIIYTDCINTDCINCPILILHETKCYADQCLYGRLIYPSIRFFLCSDHKGAWRGLRRNYTTAWFAHMSNMLLQYGPLMR